ncbi:hypothetical protein V6N13_137380 [Hibiscus sabdariffa]|uniref:Uncharacterized protein n=1 Tax=Hibiscus sabdariffa TaxID=183260 RepID=A0ABR2DMC2_9ROSI
MSYEELPGWFAPSLHIVVFIFHLNQTREVPEDVIGKSHFNDAVAVCSFRFLSIVASSFITLHPSSSPRTCHHGTESLTSSLRSKNRIPISSRGVHGKLTLQGSEEGKQGKDRRYQTSKLVLSRTDRVGNQD